MMTPPPWSPPGWTNSPVRLYHGTDSNAALSIMSLGVLQKFFQPYKDFGPGFYTTTVERQAYTWGWLRAQKVPGTSPAVVRFDVNRDSLAGLASIWFVRGGFDADDFWSLVFTCRQGGNHMRPRADPWYDIVGGPVALDWVQRQQMFDSDQISFHTLNAVQLLNSSPRRIVP